MSPAAPRVVALVQARLASRRLPGKAMELIGAKPMFERVLERVARAKAVHQAAVVTSDRPADDPLADYCRSRRLPCFRGAEDDVLDRFRQAARAFRADVVVRVTGDCPLLDPQVVDRVVAAFLEGGCDYASNVERYTYPDGLDVEVFSAAALETAWAEAKAASEREHVTPYLRTSPRFRRRAVENEVDLSPRNLRWTVDDPRDLAFVRAVYAKLGNGTDGFGMKEVLDLLDREPALAAMNADAVRNEGFYRSLLAEPPLPPERRSLARSAALKKEAERLIPSCTQTFSKGPTQFVQGVAPVFLARGRGSHVWDVDGNEYIDYPMGLGPVILGHDYPAVTEAVRRQISEGTAFTLPHPLEVEVAALLAELIPCAEMVRFGKNGSDATAGAVRAARAFTGRDVVACCGYHGWQDWYIGTTTRSAGIPEAVRKLTVPFEYNRLETLEAVFAAHPGRVAAAILEPVGLVAPRDGFLEGVRDLARREGALLIFDEIVTGFRLALGGAQELLGVKPDLACFGKAMGNGLPIAAVVGRRDVMRIFDEIFFSFTFGGDALGLAAAKATIQELRSKNVIGHLWELGRQIQDGYGVFARAFGLEGRTSCAGYPPRTVIGFRDAAGADSLELKSLFQQECLKRGVLFGSGHNVCFSHTTADVHRTLRVYRAALEIVAQAVADGNVAGRLEGPPIQPVFRRP